MSPRVVLPLALIGVLLAGPRPARAVYSCGNTNDTCQCGANNFCICCEWDGLSGNCVWYAWHRACCDWGIGLQWCTNANTFDDHAIANGYPVSTTPCADTVFVCEANATQCWAGDVGHVGWVETVYADGSIDVMEQGCYSWDGVRGRHFNAQNASPTMHYIYKPGTSCVECACTPNEVETNGCGNCGTTSRTCGGDCLWGGWSGCQGEGACSEGATEGCGTCGGTRTCQPGCQWGACVETCPDASVPLPDAAVSDAAVPADAGPATDAGPGPDGSVPPTDAHPTSDASPDDPPSRRVHSGCGCASGAGAEGLAWLLLACGLLAGRRRRAR
jgi:hypothetical protein